MCKESAKVKLSIEAVVEMPYRVVNAADAPPRARRQPVIAVLAPVDVSYGKDGALMCAVCIKARTPVSIMNVPMAVRDEYGLSEPLARAWFQPGGPNDETDYIVAGSELIPLARFVGEDVRVTVLAHAVQAPSVPDAAPARARGELVSA